VSVPAIFFVAVFYYIPVPMMACWRTLTSAARYYALRACLDHVVHLHLNTSDPSCMEGVSYVINQKVLFSKISNLQDLDVINGISQSLDESPTLLNHDHAPPPGHELELLSKQHKQDRNHNSPLVSTSGNLRDTWFGFPF